MFPCMLCLSLSSNITSRYNLKHLHLYEYQIHEYEHVINCPCNTDQTILFSYGFQTFDFRWFSVVEFKPPKSNWNNMRKNRYTTFEKPYISNWKQTFMKRWKYVLNSCCVTRVNEKSFIHCNGNDFWWAIHELFFNKHITIGGWWLCPPPGHPQGVHA